VKTGVVCFICVLTAGEPITGKKNTINSQTGFILIPDFTSLYILTDVKTYSITRKAAKNRTMNFIKITVLLND
jgi:hypothetical protein